MTLRAAPGTTNGFDANPTASLAQVVQAIARLRAEDSESSFVIAKGKSDAVSAGTESESRWGNAQTGDPQRALS